MAKYLTSSIMSPRLLGTAFGIDPELAVADDVFMRILGNSIVRAHRKRQKLIQHNTIDDAAKLLRRSRKIMVLTGAGISTSLGIPDFRSKGTGFYDKVRSLGYSAGEEVFDIIEFDRDPSVFYSLAGDILSDLNRFSPRTLSSSYCRTKVACKRITHKTSTIWRSLRESIGND